MATHFFGDTAVLTGRTMRHVTRSPDTIITTAVMPIAIMVLFVYVFGGAIDTGSVSYVNYMLPGILLIMARYVRPDIEVARVLIAALHDMVYLYPDSQTLLMAEVADESARTMAQIALRLLR